MVEEKFYFGIQTLQKTLFGAHFCFCCYWCVRI